MGHEHEWERERELDNPPIELPERLEVARDVYAKLKAAGLLASPYKAIASIKQIMCKYVSQTSIPWEPMRGEIDFPELHKVIYYRLPTRIKHTKSARVVIEHSFHAVDDES
jgi:hypothetical protein